jgi:hypothetical protein
MLSGSVSDGSSPEGSDVDDPRMMDEMDDMESDIGRLLAVTNLDDDSPHHREDAAVAAQPSAASVAEPDHWPAAQHSAPPSFATRSAGQQQEQASLQAQEVGNLVPASAASKAFLREVVTLVDDADVDHLKALQLQTCVSLAFAFAAPVV